MIVMFESAGMIDQFRYYCKGAVLVPFGGEPSIPYKYEVAHYISDIIYGLKNIKPHGKEWKAIMQAFGANAAVTANYDLSGIPLKKQSLHTYQCRCREHQLSAIRHNKIKKRHYQYYCNLCKQILQYKQQKKACG